MDPQREETLRLWLPPWGDSSLIHRAQHQPIGVRGPIRKSRHQPIGVRGLLYKNTVITVNFGFSRFFELFLNIWVFPELKKIGRISIIPPPQDGSIRAIRRSPAQFPNFRFFRYFIDIHQQNHRFSIISEEKYDFSEIQGTSPGDQNMDFWKSGDLPRDQKYGFSEISGPPRGQKILIFGNLGDLPGGKKYEFLRMWVPSQGWNSSCRSKV